MENMRRIDDETYVVWTQAGFKKACKAFIESEDTESPIEGYPDQYPSVVTFHDVYRGYHYWLAACTPLDETIRRARDYLTLLTEADAQHRTELEKGEQE